MKFPGMDKRTMEIQLADDVRAELMRLLHEERDKDRALLERLVAHLTVPPRSTWRVVELAGDGTPHDVGIEFPAQVVYVDNGSTANVQVRAPGDIAQSPPIAASGQGAWLIPGATQLTVTGTGTGQVRLRFLNEAASRLLYTGGPGGSTASPLYAELTGSLPAGTNSIGNVVGEDGSGNIWEFWFNTHTGVTGQGPWVGAAQFVYNGTNLDMIRANTQGTLLASAARTATATSPTMTNYNAKGVVVSVNVTAVAGTSPTLTVTINAISPVSGTKIPILTASTAISAIGEYAYQVYPGAAGYTQSAAAALPRTWEVDYVIGGTTPSFTFSSGYALIN